MGFSQFKRKKTSFSGVTLWISALSLLLLAASFYFLHRWLSPPPKERKVVFDTQKLWRVSDVSRVYKIKLNPLHPQEIWFCAAEGLHRFHTGEMQWNRYGLESGLPSERVADVCFQGNIPWAGTQAGISFYDSSAKTFKTYPPSLGEDILSLEYLPGKGVYYYASKKGLFLAKDENSKPQPVSITGANPIAPILCLKTIDGTLYAGVSGAGIFFYEREKDRWQAIPLDKKISQFNHFNDILKISGTLWTCASEAGIYRKDSLDDTLRYLPSFPAKGAFSFAPETDGFWCGTPWGLWRYYARRDVWIQFVHPKEKTAGDFQIYSLCADDRFLWYGSKDLGTGFFNKQQVVWQPLRAGLSHPNIAVLTAGDSVLWTGYGYRGGGIDRFNARSIQYHRNYGVSDGIEDPNVQALLRNGDVLYYGGYRGFGYKNLQTGKSRFWDEETGFPYPDIAEIYPVPQGPWYLASCFGVVRYFTAQDSFSPIASTERFRVTCMVPVGDSLWFGTLAKGLRVLNIQSGQVSEALLPADRIMGIVSTETPGNRSASLFVATKSQGCFLYSVSSGTFQPVEEIKRVFGEQGKKETRDIMSVKEMNGLIWIGTRKSGCVIYDPKKNRAGTFDYYNGLISDQIRSFTENTGFIWIGCYGGFNRIEKKYAMENIQWRP